ncbi:MAG: uroporphyrinogen decarboxylase [Legionellales bacterium]|nr:uroporphyrinogen decarboxylase [Legionellales bacterium]
MLKNDNLIRALLRKPVDYTPIWLMRQAGRYLPEYRALRERAGSFLAMATHPEIATEITLQPIRRFPLDAAILFSDILMIPHAMQLGLQFKTHEGPVFAKPVRDAKAIDELPIPDPDLDLGYVMQAVKLIKQELNQQIPLIGFAGSPWTVATYMVEGGSSKNFSTIKRLLYNEPELLKKLLRKITQATILYCQAQLNAGVDVMMIFDTWGGVLSAKDYGGFSLHYMQDILTRLPTALNGKRIPKIIFSKNCGLHLESIAATGVDAVGLDWTIDIAEARDRVGEHVALQGNLDPAMLYAKPSIIQQAARDIIQRYQRPTGHVFNLGHGVFPDVDPEHVAALIEAVHQG